MKFFINNQKGIAILGIAITIGIMAAMGSGVALMMASNQRMRMQQMYMDQSFYNSQAGVEFTLGQINGGSSSTTFTRHFKGETINIFRTGGVGGLIMISTSHGDAIANHQLTDPNPPTQANDLTINIAGANVGGNGDKRLRGVSLSNTGASTITITHATVTWTGSKTMDRIRIHSSNVWTGSDSTSGNLKDITDVSLTSSQTKNINHIRWNTDMSGTTFTLTFTMQDTSTKTTGNFTPPDG